jgi:hypothetical protein
MKKLHLDWEALRVESFATLRAEDGPGTVHAHGGTIVGVSCPAPLCHTDDDTVCGLTQAC